MSNIIEKALARVFGPRVDMRCGSSRSNPGKFWSCSVRYDAWGWPYGRNHYGSLIRLERDGTTADYRLYGTVWKERAGQPVLFPSVDSERPPIEQPVAVRIPPPPRRGAGGHV